MSLPVAITAEQDKATRAWIENFFKEYDSPEIQR